MWPNAKKIIVKNFTNQIVTTLFNSNFDTTKKFKLWQNSWLKLWQNSKTKAVTKIKSSYCDNTQRLKLWQNFKIQLWQKSKTQIVKRLQKSLLVRITWHLDNRWDLLRAVFCDLAMFYGLFWIQIWGTTNYLYLS